MNQILEKDNRSPLKKARKNKKRKIRENGRTRDAFWRARLKIPRDHNSADLNFPVVIIKCLTYHAHFYVIISHKIVQKDYKNYISQINKSIIFASCTIDSIYQ